MDKILIVYSNPTDTERLRLDREHRAIDEIVDRLGLPPETITRRHATTFEDLVRFLAESEYGVVQFSGHGSNEGIYLDSESSDSGRLIPADRIAKLLVETQPNLKLAIFLSCYSAEALAVLITTAPYLLTVFGEVDDLSAIQFIKNFYKIYLERNSIEFACLVAQNVTERELQVVLSRRALETSKGKILFQIFPTGAKGEDPLLIDLEEAEINIEALGVSREAFLSLLSRKVRLHRWIFDQPREQAVIPIGPFIGVFSWKNAKDVIRCHKILKMKPDISGGASDMWARLTVIYNDSTVQEYRTVPAPAAPFNSKILAMALEHYQRYYEIVSERNNYAEVLNLHVPEQYRLSKSLIVANLEMAQRKFHDEDLSSVVMHLESVLSAFHDLLDALTQKLAVNAETLFPELRAELA